MFKWKYNIYIYNLHPEIRKKNTKRYPFIIPFPPGFLSWAAKQAAQQESETSGSGNTEFKDKEIFTPEN